MRTPRITSPYNLMQEEYRDDPWALLVGCILFNMVHGKKARPILEEFLKLWPNSRKLWECYEDDLLTVPLMIELFTPLGFQNRRAERILYMTTEFNALRPDINNEVDVMELNGVGKYAADSFNMFYRGYLVKDVTDKELKNYVCWAESQPEGAGSDLRTSPPAPDQTSQTV